MPIKCEINNVDLDLEAKLLRDSSDESFAPSLYLCYVDDIFCVFRQDSSHQQFLDKLNCLHPNLKFTSEVGPSVLPYLDTTISLPTTEDGCFTSKVFRKRTNTGLCDWRSHIYLVVRIYCVWKCVLCVVCTYVCAL